LLWTFSFLVAWNVGGVDFIFERGDDLLRQLAT
jgi:hypothetical protein